MRKLYGKPLFLAAALTAGCGTSPKQGSTYTFKEVGWTVTIPAPFKIVDQAGAQKMNEKGVALMEKTMGTKLDISSTRTLITARKGTTASFFSATITPYDEKKDGDYPSASRAVKDVVYKTFTDQMPDATLDSASEPVKVGGLDFDRYRVSASIKGKPLFTMFLLSRLYKGYDFGLSYLYTDKESQMQVENILASSKFQ